MIEIYKNVLKIYKNVIEIYRNVHTYREMPYKYWYIEEMWCKYTEM